ncbi:MAG: hypothetical protein WA761_07500 [Thermoplasmata archaeon]
MPTRGLTTSGPSLSNPGYSPNPDHSVAPPGAFPTFPESDYPAGHPTPGYGSATYGTPPVFTPRRQANWRVIAGVTRLIGLAIAGSGLLVLGATLASLMSLESSLNGITTVYDDLGASAILAGAGVILLGIGALFQGFATY